LVTLYGAAGLFWWMLRQIARDQSALAPVDRLAMALPMAGKVHRDFSLGRFFAALGALLNAGIAILEALPRAAAACGSALLANAARAAVPLLKQGESLTVIFADIVPPDALSILSTGQESGRLDDALARLERHFFEEGRRRLRTVAEWLPKLIYLAVVLWVAWQIIRMALGYRRMLSGLLDD
jgi:general secretion pathway protein F/type IV pilus assembly protein PilC